MEDSGEITILADRNSLESFTENQARDSSKSAPIGVILSLEGADPIVKIRDLEKLTRAGLRALGPAHYGQGRYAAGTDAFDSFPTRGLELLDEMNRLHLILDVTHLRQMFLAGDGKIHRTDLGKPLKLPRHN